MWPRQSEGTGRLVIMHIDSKPAANIAQETRSASANPELAERVREWYARENAQASVLRMCQRTRRACRR
eukprot:11172381-Lingulodinium_polyedra.AAC.1